MAKRTKPTKTKIKDWLKGKGHKMKDVDDALTNIDNSEGLRTLHVVTAQQWRDAGGK